MSKTTETFTRYDTADYLTSIGYDTRIYVPPDDDDWWLDPPRRRRPPRRPW